MLLFLREKEIYSILSMFTCQVLGNISQAWETAEEKSEGNGCEHILVTKKSVSV